MYAINIKMIKYLFTSAPRVYTGVLFNLIYFKCSNTRSRALSRETEKQIISHD